MADRTWPSPSPNWAPAFAGVVLTKDTPLVCSAVLKR